jgi:hypothetical protein
MNLVALNAPKNTSFGSISPVVGGVSNMFIIIASIVALVILFAIYYETVGYYIQIGWDKLKWSRDQGETVKMNIPGTEISGELTPSSTSTSTSAHSSIQSTIGSVAQTIESDVEAALAGSGNEVFNVSRNIYSFADAEPLCKAFGAELATFDQVKEAYEKGADWCNYGWSKGQLALYPTQEETWKKLQEGPEDQRMSCGKPGVNGGSFSNPDQRFGVNCFGKRPVRTALDEQLGKSPETKFDRDVARFKYELDTIPVTPWNIKSWSKD